MSHNPYYYPPRRASTGRDTASGLLIGFGIAVAVLAGIAFHAIRADVTVCSNSLVSTLNSQQCTGYANINDLSLAGVVIGAVMFITGIVMHLSAPGRL